MFRFIIVVQAETVMTVVVPVVVAVLQFSSAKSADFILQDPVFESSVSIFGNHTVYSVTEQKHT